MADTDEPRRVILDIQRLATHSNVRTLTITARPDGSMTVTANADEPHGLIMLDGTGITLQG